MWLHFAPPVVRWIMLGCFVFLGLLLLVMPKHERAQLFRDIRRGRKPRPPSATARGLGTAADVGDTDPGGWSQEPWPDDPQLLRSVGRVTVAARVLTILSATAVLVLLIWMAIVFLTNLPGWS